MYVESLALSSSKAYVFSEGELITAFSNTPNLTNMRNDYSIWGVRASLNGTEVPVHMRYAIDEKPVYYKNMEGKVFLTDRNVFEQLKSAAKDKVVDGLVDRLKNYKLTYDIPEELPKPIKQENGSWSPTPARCIKGIFEHQKNITYCEPIVTIRSCLSDESNQALMALAENLKEPATT